MIPTPLLKRVARLLLATVVLGSALVAQTPTGLAYDLVYVRAPRNGDDSFVHLPEVFHPIQIAPGTDLMLLHPDGSDFDAFLQAELGEDRNGVAVTVLSALARVGLEPWTEAKELARLVELAFAKILRPIG